VGGLPWRWQKHQAETHPGRFVKNVCNLTFAAVTTPPVVYDLFAGEPTPRTYPLRVCFMSKIALQSGYVVPIVSTQQKTYRLGSSFNALYRWTCLWRFNPGDLVYVRGWSNEDVALVVERLEGQSWPMYACNDMAGKQWILSHIVLSLKPIYET